MPVATHDHISFPNDDSVEVIFLGTGTSSGLPNVHCLTAPPEDEQCRTCLSTLQPEGKKNIRRNTSVAMRVRGNDGNKITVVIDVGKSFQAAALEWFPKHGLRRIDAVLITHAHADAMNGLDDLRGWTLRGAIQPYVDLYCSEATYKEVQRAFPYLVSKEYASGGGDVPEFKWHIIEDRVPFEIENTGVRIKPFSVHHGRVFSTAPPVGYEFMPSPPMGGSPTSTTSSTPNPPGSPIQHPTSLTTPAPSSQPLTTHDHSNCNHPPQSTTSTPRTSLNPSSLIYVSDSWSKKAYCIFRTYHLYLKTSGTIYCLRLLPHRMEPKSRLMIQMVFTSLMAFMVKMELMGSMGLMVFPILRSYLIAVPRFSSSIVFVFIPILPILDLGILFRSRDGSMLKRLTSRALDMKSRMTNISPSRKLSL
ncbi:hypothetical protein QCA50_001473 [Cerrena zonata]|uniref:Metallo-beta-lactamase domain-containing protein n=1 Tax=Cerrena zonata TaxID=2478898 RepID=A0AAW0GX84_9APHY